MSLKAFIAASKVKIIKLDGEDISVNLATLAQMEQFQNEAAQVEAGPAANVAFACKWLAVLCPEFAELGFEDLPPVLVIRIFEAVIAEAFGAKKKD
jgi:hypothetical protein